MLVYIFKHIYQICSLYKLYTFNLLKLNLTT